MQLHMTYTAEKTRKETNKIYEIACTYRTGDTVQIGLAAKIFDDIAGSFGGTNALLVVGQSKH